MCACVGQCIGLLLHTGCHEDAVGAVNQKAAEPRPFRGRCAQGAVPRRGQVGRPGADGGRAVGGGGRAWRLPSLRTQRAQEAQVRPSMSRAGWTHMAARMKPVRAVVHSATDSWGWVAPQVALPDLRQAALEWNRMARGSLWCYDIGDGGQMRFRAAPFRRTPAE